VQLDPIRHVERTHLLVLWSRLGAFDTAELERLRFEEQTLVDGAACFVSGWSG
jgi:uncharacterized protein